MKILITTVILLLCVGTSKADVRIRVARPYCVGPYCYTAPAYYYPPAYTYTYPAPAVYSAPAYPYGYTYAYPPSAYYAPAYGYYGGFSVRIGRRR